MPLGPTIMPAGNIQSNWILTLSLTPAATATVTTAEQTFTVPGVQLGDQLTLSATFAYTSLVDYINVRVSAANTIAVAFSNNTAGSLTAPAGIYQLEVNRPYPGLPMSAIQ